MKNASIQLLTEFDSDWLAGFLREHWGSEMIVTRGRVHHPRDLMGFRSVSVENELLGVVTFTVSNSECEIVSLNAVHTGMGVGTQLLDAVEQVVRKIRCQRMWLITTNDNTSALRFYQKRGFRLVAVHKNAVDEARRIKPEIPWIGMDGIEIHDEIELEKVLS